VFFGEYRKEPESGKLKLIKQKRSIPVICRSRRGETDLVSVGIKQGGWSEDNNDSHFWFLLRLRLFPRRKYTSLRPSHKEGPNLAEIIGHVRDDGVSDTIFTWVQEKSSHNVT
jgi:hypothetical protein